jgi:hypothetical protein
MIQIPSATIRRDFSHVGELGRSGYGYEINRQTFCRCFRHFFLHPLSSLLPTSHIQFITVPLSEQLVCEINKYSDGRLDVTVFILYLFHKQVARRGEP